MSIQIGAEYEAKEGTLAHDERGQGHTTWIALERTGRGYRFKAEDGCTSIWPAGDMVRVTKDVEIVSNHQKDIDTIFEALQAEAEDRDWCDMYQEFLDELLPKLSVQPKKGVKRDFEVEVLGEEYTVYAESQEAAEDFVKDILNNRVDYYTGKLKDE
jgi:hypothetical protein